MKNLGLISAVAALAGGMGAKIGAFDRTTRHRGHGRGQGSNGTFSRRGITHPIATRMQDLLANPTWRPIKFAKKAGEDKEAKKLAHRRMAWQVARMQLKRERAARRL